MKIYWNDPDLPELDARKSSTKQSRNSKKEENIPNDLPRYRAMQRNKDPWISFCGDGEERVQLGVW